MARMIVGRRQRAIRLAVVRVLMAIEVQDLDQLPPVLRAIAKDEAAPFKLVEHRRYVDRVEGEQLTFDALRPVLKAAFTIGQQPQASEAQPRLEVAFRQVFILEETWLEIACACHS